MRRLLILLFVISYCSAGLPTTRKNIEALTTEELLCYREAFQTAIDNGSFEAVARWHGMPFMSRPENSGFSVHGTPTFLLWHRFYLSVMEMIIGCPIPYWDWRSPVIPTAFSDTYYTCRNGTSILNPLHAAPLPVDVRTVDNQQPMTQRYPDLPFPGAELDEKERYALYGTNDFESFSAAIEDCHNLAHVALGGGMSSIEVAAFDPMFWSLHMNVERLFLQWQLMHDDCVYVPEITTMPIELNNFIIPASELLHWSDGWQQGAPENEIDRWKQTLKATLARRPRIPHVSHPQQPATTAPLTPSQSSGNSTTSETPIISATQAAAQLAASIAPPPIQPKKSPETVESKDPMQQTQSDPAALASGSNLSSENVPETTAAPVIKLESIQHIECPFAVADISTSRVEDRIILTVEQVSSTPEPYVLLVVLDNRIVGRIGMFGMGPSPMNAYVMDRHVDISRAFEKLGYKAKETMPEELVDSLEFRMKSLRTSAQTQYNPPRVSINTEWF